ncbi:MAG TPA: hypothetical protein VFQ54_10505 [Thermomicrobiales bacterium]|nr:hypothetical protein [Thermomicrobiales bacterium]
MRDPIAVTAVINAGTILATTPSSKKGGPLPRILLLVGLIIIVRTFMRRTEHPIQIHFPPSLEATVTEPLKTDGPTLFSPPDAIDPLDVEETTADDTAPLSAHSPN